MITYQDVRGFLAGAGTVVFVALVYLHNPMAAVAVIVTGFLVTGITNCVGVKP